MQNFEDSENNKCVKVIRVKVFKNGFADIDYSDGGTMLIDKVYHINASLIKGHRINSSNADVLGIVVYNNCVSEIVYSNGTKLVVENTYISSDELHPDYQINIGIKE